MEDKKQKYFIFGGVALATVVIIIFWVMNFNFIIDGGFAGNKKTDNTWENITGNFTKTMGVVKEQLAGSKKSTTSSTVQQAELLKIMREKIESVSSTTSSQ